MSSEYRLAIVIDANGTPAVAAINKVTGATGQLTNAQRGASSGADRMAQSTKRAEGELTSLGTTARRVQGFLVSVFGAAVVREVIGTTNRLDGMRRTLEGVLGSGQAAARGIAFVRAEADRLGVAFEPALQGYTRLAAAANGTPLAPKVNELTAAVLQAGRAMNLSGEEIGGAITAIEQMISKGTVSAEELRGQLGERIPGAFQIAARSMNLTTAELDKMLSTGQVVATDFLPKFAAELSRSTAAAAGLNAASPAAELARIGNELQGIAADIGEGIFSALGDDLSELTAKLREFNEGDFGNGIGQALGTLASNADVALAAMAAFAGAKGLGAAVLALQSLGVVARPLPATIASAGLAFQALNVPVVGNTAAITGWTRAATVASAVGKGLFALMGGWPGLLALAAAGTYALVTAQTQAEKSADALKQATDALAGSSESNRAATLADVQVTRQKVVEDLKAAKAALARAQANAAINASMPREAGPGEAAFRAGVAIVDVASISRAEKAIAALQKSLSESDVRVGELTGKKAQVEQFFKAFDKAAGVTKLLRALGLAAEEIPAPGGSGGADEWEKLKKAADDYIDTLREQIETLGMSRAEQVRWEAASKASKAATQSQGAEIRRLGEILARKIETQEVATEAEREAKRVADALAAANERLGVAYAEMAYGLQDVANAQQDFSQLQSDLFGMLAGPGEQAMAQYKRDLEVIDQYLTAMFAAGPLPADQAAAIEERVRAATEGAKRGYEESMREIAQRAGTDFEEIFRQAFENGIKGASLEDFWKTITEGFKRAVAQGGAQGAANFVAGGIDMIGGAYNAYQQAGGGAGGVSAALARLPIPVVQPIAQALNTINSIFGGRLFGTNWETRGSSNQFSIANGQASGSSSVSQSRQRSLFRGTARRTQTTALSGESLDAINGLMASAQQALAGAARAVGAEVPELLAFAFKQEFDSKGNLIRETATIAGQQFSESLEQAAARYVGRNVLALLETIDPALSALSARFAATGTDVLDFAQAMLLAQSDIQRGTGLITDGSLSAVGEVLESLRQPGEAVAQTYQRVWVSTRMYLDALSLLDGAMQESTAEVVAFASDAVDALGGLDAAAAAFNAVLSTFFTDAERAALRLQEAQTRVAQESSSLGADGVTSDNYRSRFDAARQAGLTPEEFAGWIRLGVAIADASQAAADLAEASGETADAMRDQAGVAQDLSEAANAAAQAYEDLGEFTRGLNDQMTALARDGMNDFVGGIEDVQEWTRESIIRANELARAAGFQGAAEETLTEIHRIAAMRIGQAMQQLERETASLIESLYGAADAVEEVDPQSANSPLRFAHDLARGFREIVDEIDPQRYQQALQVAENLFNLSWASGDDALDIGERLRLPFDQFIRDLGVDLTRLGEASQFDGLVQAARALGVELPELADRIGVSLGSLSDASSLINNGFERLLGRLTEEQAAPIRDLLSELETAPESERGRITTALNAAVNSLPAELRALLAPYLDDVDISPPEQAQIDATSRVETAVQAGNSLLDRILASIGRYDPDAKPGSGNVLVRGEKIGLGSAEAKVDLAPVAVAVDDAARRQVAELQTAARNVRSVESAVMASNQLLEQLIGVLRREAERTSTAGLKIR